jgi:phosphatidylserine/phosphatidylglycerophosphate/cardiolipin synthase-like enzyme
MLRFPAALVAAALLTTLATPALAATPTRFNRPAHAPGTSAARQNVFTDAVAQAVDRAPRGSWVTVSMFSISNIKDTDSLIRAHRRGVHVRYVTWDRDLRSKQANRLKAELKTDLSKSSWFKMCVKSCARSGQAGSHHAKLVTISNTSIGGKPVRWLTFTPSGNLTNSSGRDQWNEFQTITGRPIYKRAKDYVLALSRDRNLYDVPDAVSGGTRLMFFPRKRLRLDPVLDLLKATSCRRGDKIRVSMFIWSYNRIALAKRLAYLNRHGCDVRVVLTRSKNGGAGAGKRVIAALRSGPAKGRMHVYDANVRGMYMHAKSTVISARVHGRHQDITLAGSANFSKSAQTSDSDDIVQLASKDEARRHFGWFDVVTCANAKRGTRCLTAQPI